MGKGLPDKSVFRDLDVEVEAKNHDDGMTFGELLEEDGQGRLDDNP